MRATAQTNVVKSQKSVYIVALKIHGILETVRRHPVRVPMLDGNGRSSEL